MADAPFDYEEIIFYILNDLNSNYKEILTAICARNSPIYFEELHGKHSDYEIYLNESHYLLILLLSLSILLMKLILVTKARFTNSKMTV